MVLLSEEIKADNGRLAGKGKPVLSRRITSITSQDLEDYETQRTEWFLKSIQRFNSQPDLLLGLQSLETNFQLDGSGVMVGSPLGKERSAVSSYQSWVSSGPVETLVGSPTKSPKRRVLKTEGDAEELIRHKKLRELKNSLRESHWSPDDPIRGRLWPMLVNMHSAEGKSSQPDILESLYRDSVKQIYGTTDLQANMQLPSLLDSRHLKTYHLDKEGVLVATRIVNVLAYSFPDITYAPAVYSICCLLLHYLPECETYQCLSTMIASRRVRFLSQTKRHFEANWRTVMILSRKHAKTGCAFLSKKMGDSTKAESIFKNWFWYIIEDLPFPILVRILDNFLCEGRKALYRVWFAILNQFQKDRSTGSPVKAENMDSSLRKFCQDLSWNPEKLIKSAYSIRGLKGADIERTFVKTEMYLKSRSMSLTHPNFGRSMSSDPLPTSQTQQNVQQSSRTLTVRELLSLWSWLPVRITMYQPILLYTSEEHGCSLMTFFTRVENHGPTIMIIKACTGEVFGAYCSSPWSKRNEKDGRGNRQAYFGTGESFVFTLYPERKKYPWVGLDTSKSQEEKKQEKGSDLFMAADSHMLVVGGGKGQAIYLDADLRFGKTDTCLTFGNPPLCPSKDFEIQVIEVYGFVGHESP